MSFYAFRLLSPVMQVYWVLRHGTYLARRPSGQGWVNLYHCADEGRGFFAEVGIGQEKLVVLRSFVGSKPLEYYGHYVQLPEW